MVESRALLCASSWWMHDKTAELATALANVSCGQVHCTINHAVTKFTFQEQHNRDGDQSWSGCKHNFAEEPHSWCHYLSITCAKRATDGSCEQGLANFVTDFAVLGFNTTDAAGQRCTVSRAKTATVSKTTWQSYCRQRRSGRG